MKECYFFFFYLCHIYVTFLSVNVVFCLGNGLYFMGFRCSPVEKFWPQKVTEKTLVLLEGENYSF